MGTLHLVVPFRYIYWPNLIEFPNITTKFFTELINSSCPATLTVLSMSLEYLAFFMLSAGLSQRPLQNLFDTSLSDSNHFCIFFHFDMLHFKLFSFYSQVLYYLQLIKILLIILSVSAEIATSDCQFFCCQCFFSAILCL